MKKEYWIAIAIVLLLSCIRVSYLIGYDRGIHDQADHDRQVIVDTVTATPKVIILRRNCPFFPKYEESI